MQLFPSVLYSVMTCLCHIADDNVVGTSFPYSVMICVRVSDDNPVGMCILFYFINLGLLRDHFFVLVCVCVCVLSLIHI